MENQAKAKVKRINYIEINGHLGNDPELIETKNGKKVVRFSMAQHYFRNSAKNTSWYTVLAWEEMAVQMMEVLQKGTLVNVKGKLINRVYTDPGGKTHQVYEIVAKEFFTEPASVKQAG
ncbi:MAG: single-stranded DNA-binding protein [Bacteroidetes bacterium]|nr:single-stranded DNA-binding protein [Bacteroidota bacterium]